MMKEARDVRRVCMVAMIVVLWCWACPRGASNAVAEQRDASGDSLVSQAALPKTNRALKDRGDRYQDPFVPKAVVRDAIPSPPPPPPPPTPTPTQEPVRENVLVRGIISSPQGRWALLEFENGERYIVVAGQVIAASSQVVTRITDQGVTLSSLKRGTDPLAHPDRTYVLDH